MPEPRNSLSKSALERPSTAGAVSGTDDAAGRFPARVRNRSYRSPVEPDLKRSPVVIRSARMSGCRRAVWATKRLRARLVWMAALAPSSRGTAIALLAAASRKPAHNAVASLDSAAGRSVVCGPVWVSFIVLPDANKDSVVTNWPLTHAIFLLWLAIGQRIPDPSDPFPIRSAPAMLPAAAWAITIYNGSKLPDFCESTKGQGQPVVPLRTMSKRHFCHLLHRTIAKVSYMI